MFLKELISQSWQSLMRNRLRSALTMLGIVWGLASVVILLAYGQGLGGMKTCPGDRPSDFTE